MDAAGWQYLAWLLRLLFFPFFGICHFLSVGGAGGRCQVPSPTQPRSAEVGGSGSPKVGTRAGLPWGQSPSRGHHQRFGDKEPLRVLPAAVMGGGRRQVAAGGRCPRHIQRGQKAPGRNWPQTSMQEQCISLLVQDFNEHFNLMFK